MDTRYLNYFLEIAKHRNLSKAATYLFVTQSTLSQFLAKEEESLGVKLFIRDKKEMKLTYAGELYAETCKEMLDAKDRLYRKLSDLGQSRTGIIRLGITPQWGGIVLSSVLPSFLEKYPNNNIKLYEDIAHPHLENITNNELDMAFLALNDSDLPDLPMIPVSKEELILAVPKTFAIEAGITAVNEQSSPETNELLSVNIEELKAYPFIVSKERTVIRDIINAMFRSADITPHIISEINNHEASLSMAASGMGITIIPKRYLREHDDLIYCRCAPGWFWSLYIITRRGYELRPADHYLIELIKKTYES